MAKAPSGPVIRPQAGPQQTFLSTSADIAIYGGAAGGGKSWALLMEPLRHATTNPGFSAAFFRRTTVQVRNPGGLWDESLKLYGQIPGAQPLHTLEWKFAGGGKVKFAHLEYDSTVLDWQGSQVPLLCFDELTHFTKTQFWYLLSRNRSMCGVRPYVRATCNPDADSWVAELIAWWLDPDTGQAIPERAGVVRWFVRINDTLVWADRPSELACYTYLDEDGNEVPIPPKSLTFIPAKLSDNRALMAADPGYLASLMALPMVDRERLLGGNWKIRPAAGLYFQRGWVRMVDAHEVPADLRTVRGWDLASTPKTEQNDPDWTAGTKMGRSRDGTFYVLHHTRVRGTPNEVDALLLNTASHDGKACMISLPQDPGQGTRWQAAHFRKLLAGYNVRISPESRKPIDTPAGRSAKVTRFGPFSAQVEAGRKGDPNVYVLRGAWNDAWFAALEAFPEAKHDDDADATSRAFNELMSGQHVGIVAPIVHSVPSSVPR